MPVPLIVIILGLVAVLAVAVVLVLKWDEIVHWFQHRNDIKDADRSNIAFTLQQKLDSGEYKTVQGIFNKRTSTVVEGRAVQSKEVDGELAAVHAANELVVYE